MYKHFFMALVGSLIGISAWAQTTHYYTSPAGDYKLHYQIQSDKTAGITKWEVLDKSKAHFDIVIPKTVSDSYGTWTVTRTVGNAFGTANDDDRIISVTFPESFKIIDTGSFTHCTGLTSLTLPSQLEAIGNNAFAVCSNLRGNLIIPETVKTIGEAAFMQCGFDGTLDLPDHLQTLGARAFYNCSSLTGELVLPETLTELAHEVFASCKGFTGTLKIPASITKIDYSAFNECKGFTGDLILPNGITYIGSTAFRECTGFNGRLHLPTSLRHIGNIAFATNHFTGELVLPEGLETIESLAFHASQNLSGNIKLPATLKTLGDGAFKSSPKIESITATPGMKLTKLGNDVFNIMAGLRFIDLTDATIPVGSVLDRSTSSPFMGVYKDVLIYLPASVGETGLAAGQENFVVGDHCANFVVYDEYDNRNGYNTNYARDVNYKIRHAFTADKASYNRSFSGTTCKTVYLPYPAKLPETLAPYLLRRQFDDKGKEYLQFERASGNTLTANTPYLLVPEKNITNGTQFPVTEGAVEVPVTPEPQDVQGSQDASVSFTGTTHSIANADAAALGAYNLSNNIWRPVSTAKASGFIHRFRSFIKVNAAAPAKAFSFGIFLSDNTTTGIEETSIHQNLNQKQLNIYTIDGKFAGRDFDALEGGQVYIVDGKKIYKL
jgi:hypothetical protein